LAPTSAFLLLHFCFKCFVQTSSSSSQAKKDKNTKKKKTIEKKKYVEKGRNLPSNSHFSLSFLVPTSALLLLHIRFKCFLLTSFFSQAEGKRKNTKKKKP
jgi:hypothetical protein